MFSTLPRQVSNSELNLSSATAFKLSSLKLLFGKDIMQFSTIFQTAVTRAPIHAFLEFCLPVLHRIFFPSHWQLFHVVIVKIFSFFHSSHKILEHMPSFEQCLIQCCEKFTSIKSSHMVKVKYMLKCSKK